MPTNNIFSHTWPYASQFDSSRTNALCSQDSVLELHLPMQEMQAVERANERRTGEELICSETHEDWADFVPVHPQKRQWLLAVSDLTLLHTCLHTCPPY